MLLRLVRQQAKSIQKRYTVATPNQANALQMRQDSPQDEANESPQDEAIENLSDEARKIVLQVRSKDKSHLNLKEIEKEREERYGYARLHLGKTPHQFTSLGTTQQICKTTTCQTARVMKEYLSSEKTRVRGGQTTLMYDKISSYKSD